MSLCIVTFQLKSTEVVTWHRYPMSELSFHIHEDRVTVEKKGDYATTYLFSEMGKVLFTDIKTEWQKEVALKLTEALAKHKRRGDA